MTTIPTTPETIVLPSPGYCIYCGTDEGPLTDEHIIPRGVNGHVLLKGSTCKAHQTLTSAIEGEIQAADKRGMFAETRLILGMRTYTKKKHRPTHVKLGFIGANGKRFKKDVPVAEAHAVHIMPALIQPRFLTQAPPFPNADGVEVYAVANHLVEGAMQEVMRRVGATGIDGRTTIPMGSLLRYLCKIAYGVHFVQHGPFERSESPALALLLGERKDFGNWVGCVPMDLEVPGTDWHRIELVDLETQSGHTFEAVQISLFNNLAPCTYVVVTRCVGYQSMVA